MTEAAVRLTVPLLPKQKAFVRSSAREALYSGAFGAGKTRALCWKLVARASLPGACELLCRKHNITLKRTTLRTLLEADGDLPPVLHPGTYTHNKQLQTIRIRGGGMIMYFGLDDPDKIGSTSATGAAVDEAVELTEEDWTALRGRIRVKIKGLANQLYGACNPGAPTHHLARRFGLAMGGEAQPGCEAITTRTEDNFFLDRAYVADLLTFTGVALQRYVKGLWVAAEGLVFPGLLDVFIPHREPPPGTALGGIDFGFRNPFCALLATVYESADGRDIVYVYWERYQAGVDLGVHADALDAQPRGRDATWFCDPEDPEAARDLRKRDLSARKAVNKVLYGIDAVNGLLAGAQLYVSEACASLRSESEVYCYSDRDTRERPVDKYDHAMTALRYLVASGRKRGLIRSAQATRDAQREDSDAA